MKTSENTVAQRRTQVVFFLLLAASLFLGDSREPIVNMLLAGFCVGALIYNRKRLMLLPHVLRGAWVVFGAAFVLSSWGSIDIARSVWAGLRFLLAYEILLLFSSFPPTPTRRTFLLGTVFLGVVASVGSMVFLLRPGTHALLPTMNLLHATFGHNHLSDLLVFVFPALLALPALGAGTLWATSIGIIVFVAFALTFSRGGLILLGLYFLFKRRRTPTLGIMSAILAGIILMIAVFSFAPTGAAGWMKNTWIGRQVIKPSIVQDGRRHYFQQALQSFAEKPLLGSGPGTFSLASRRLQTKPTSFSWFAHSLPLEMLSEMGIVGLLSLSVIIFYVLSLALRALREAQDKKQGSIVAAIYSSLLLVLIYSLFEFTLNFSVLWALWWAGAGVVIARPEGERPRPTPTSSPLPALALATILTSFLGGTFLSAFSQHAPLALRLAPYSSQVVRNVLSHSEWFGEDELGLILFFHRGDPDMLLTLIQEGGAPTIGVARKKELFEMLLVRDPRNERAHELYARFLITTKNNEELAAWTSAYTKYFLPQGLARVAPTLSSSEAALAAPSIGLLFDSYMVHELRFAIVYYLAGLASKDTNPTRTAQLWTFARASASSWSYFYLEEASLLEYALGDHERAQSVLAQCQQSPEAAAHCKEVRAGVLPLPGSFHNAIVSIAGHE